VTFAKRRLWHCGGNYLNTIYFLTERIYTYFTYLFVIASDSDYKYPSFQKLKLILLTHLKLGVKIKLAGLFALI